MTLAGVDFVEVVLVDFEFTAPPGERPRPVCMVAQELVSGRRHRLFQEELLELPRPPFPIDERTLVVTFYGSAEWSCFLALGWELPAATLDLYVEFGNRTNGRRRPAGRGLLGALMYYGLESLSAAEKGEMRGVAMRGGPFTAAERDALLVYYESDVLALRRLLTAMETDLDVPRGVVRSRFMQVVAQMEFAGIPVDAARLARLKDRWDEIKSGLIRKVDASYGVFEGSTFKMDRFRDWLSVHDIAWPHADNGLPRLDYETFSDMAKIHPAVKPLGDLRHALSQLRWADIPVGSDGRSRLLLSPFASLSSRNQPSNSKFIFGMPAWTRGLVRPAPGFGLAYLDYEQQEYGIAAALSGDEKMMQAYRSGDPYLAFAKEAGAVPAHGTRESHPVERSIYKQVVLAVNYGMGPESLGLRIAKAPAYAKALLDRHRSTYRRYWQWSDSVVTSLQFMGYVETVFGWRLHLGAEVKERTVRNFPVQANGAEMLRLACILAADLGVKIVAPVHDAILIEAPLDDLDVAITVARQAMKEASEVVLDGFQIETDVKVIRAPDRFMETRGEKMWKDVSDLLGWTDGAEVAQ